MVGVAKPAVAPHQRDFQFLHRVLDDVGGEFTAEKRRRDFGEFVGFVKNHDVRLREHPRVVPRAFGFRHQGHRRQIEVMIHDGDVRVLRAASRLVHEAFREMRTLIPEAVFRAACGKGPRRGIFRHPVTRRPIPDGIDLRKFRNAPQVFGGFRRRQPPFAHRHRQAVFADVVRTPL